MWDIFWRVQEPGKGKALVAHIVSKRWTTIKDKLSSTHRLQLERRFFSLICHLAPDKALEWLENLEKRETDAARRGELRLMRVELLVYHLDDLDAARKAAKVVMSRSGDLAMKARIRLADIEFLAGNYNEARKMYGEVQSRVNHGKRATGKQGGKGGVQDWRIGAIRSTASSETVRSLMKQGYYLEAREVLDAWETEFPLSKLTGDYMVVEASYYIETGNYVRAKRVLDAYCAGMEATSYLPEALKQTLVCMIKMDAPNEELGELCAEIKKRFPYHPVGEEVENLWQILKGGTGIGREATKDMP